MVVEHLDSALLAWLGTYLVHSTILLLAAWTLGRILSRSRRLADALPSIRESLWRVALLAGLVTASAQRVLEVDPGQVLWTIESRASATPMSTVAGTAAPMSTTRELDAPAIAAGELASVPASDASLATRPSPRSELALDAIPFLPLFVPGALASSPAPIWVATAFLASQGGAVRAPHAVPPLATRVATDVPRAAASVAPLAVPPERIPAASLATEPSSSGVSWPRVLLTLWLAGIAAGGALWAREWITLRRRLRGRVELDRGPVYEAFARLCRRTETRGVRLTCAPGLSAPITLGLLRSEIVLPPRATTQLSDDELEALFAHELAHARRGDPSWLVIYRALEVVFFFQPLNRVARVRLQDEAELLADDWAATQLAERVSLASCLTEIAGWIVDERRLLPAPAMAARGTRLSVRVRRLLDDEHHPERARRPHGLLLLAGLAVTGVALFGPAIAAERPTSRTTPIASFVASDDELDRVGENSEAVECSDEPCADDASADDDELACDDDPCADESEPDDDAPAQDEDDLDAEALVLDVKDAERTYARALAKGLELGDAVAPPPSQPFLVRSVPAPARGDSAWYLARYAAPRASTSAHGLFGDALALAPKASAQATVAVPVDVVAELQAELHELRLLAMQHDTTPELRSRLDELEHDVASLQQRVSELGVLVQRAFTVSIDQVP